MTLRDELAVLSPSDFWQTPPAIIARVIAMAGGEFHDPCPATCTELTPDGLATDWPTDKLCYVNPPYSRVALARWAERIAVQARRGCEIVALLPSSTGAQWWVAHVWGAADALCFVTGRIAFVDPAIGEASSGCGRFWSALVYYGPRSDAFFDAFGDMGELARLKVQR